MMFPDISIRSVYCAGLNTVSKGQARSGNPPLQWALFPLQSCTLWSMGYSEMRMGQRWKENLGATESMLYTEELNRAESQMSPQSESESVQARSSSRIWTKYILLLIYTLINCQQVCARVLKIQKPKQCIVPLFRIVSLFKILSLSFS